MKKILIGATVIIGIAAMYIVLGNIGDYLNVPNSENWSSVSQAIYQELQPGDGIAFSPSWLLGYATDNNRFGFASFFELKKIFEKKSLRPAGLWVIAREFGPRLAKRIEDAGYEPRNLNRNGAIYYSYYRDQEEKIMFDFDQQLSQAEAWLEDAQGGKETAVFAKNQWTFGSVPQDWSYINVRSVILSFGQKRKNAIWFHPVNNKVKKMRFSNVPMGNNLKLLLGLADSGRTYDAVRSCFFSLDINDNYSKRLKIDEGNPEQFWQIDTKDFPHNSTVTFGISCDRDVTQRHIFFSAATYQSPKQ